MGFKIGDVVQLKSGGPEMTVTGVDADETVYCAWFVGTKQNGGHFPAGSLNKVR